MEYKEFIESSLAENKGDGMWDVYSGIFKVPNCTGDSEAEAKESAWNYLQNIKDKLDGND